MYISFIENLCTNNGAPLITKNGENILVCLFQYISGTLR